MHTKAIIPVAGAGTRLRPLTYTQPKPLIPVAGKPIISFIIDQLIEVGVRDFIFVIGYLGEKIKNYVEQAYPLTSKSNLSIRRFDLVLHMPSGLPGNLFEMQMTSLSFLVIPSLTWISSKYSRIPTPAWG